MKELRDGVRAAASRSRMSRIMASCGIETMLGGRYFETVDEDEECDDMHLFGNNDSHSICG